MALLTRARRRELGNRYVAGVEWSGEPADRAAFAGGVPTLEEDQERRAERSVTDQPGTLQTQRQQPPLRTLQPLLGFLAGERQRQINLVQCSHQEYSDSNR